jgi:eukaryotic-like serine/threonine-protein kinase
MLHRGAVVDGMFRVLGVCSDSGGMGTVLFVDRSPLPDGSQLVLKYCKLDGVEQRSRFRREVRVMQEFVGNGRVMPVIHANLEHDPPYFVMPYMARGDLGRHAAEVRQDLERVEVIFNQMLDCVHQLHSRGVMHRDIKPQNFLLGDDDLVLSDLGLCCEEDSTTAFTRSSTFWGTPGYIPPEFLTGGFKGADPAADIFMLGKTFYFVLTGREPLYVTSEGVPPQLFPILDRCCQVSKATRYQSLAELKRSLKAAFDIIFLRLEGSSRVYGTVNSVRDQLAGRTTFLPTQVLGIVEEVLCLKFEDCRQILMELPSGFFLTLAAVSQQADMTRFLYHYGEMVENATYRWSLAEAIAHNMKLLFEGESSARDKAETLRIALLAAYRQNRYAAMELCTQMISSIHDDDLAQRVSELILRHPYSFIARLDESKCKAQAIRTVVAQLKVAAVKIRKSKSLKKA